MTKILSSLFLIGVTSSAIATTGAITLNNFAAADNNLIADSNGTSLTSTTSAYFIGSMNEAGIATSTTVTELFGHFTSFGEVRGGGDINPTIAPGFVAGDAQGDFATVDTMSVYVFIMNAADAASADEALIWKYTDGHAAAVDQPKFADDPNPVSVGPQTIDLISANGEAVFGVDAVGNNAYLLQTVVPEPSSTALFGLGSVAFLLRRRR